MKAIKSFDLFQKIIIESEFKPTIFGSLISIFVILLLIFLVIKETILYLTPLIIKESIVQNLYNTNNDSHFNLNLKLKLYDTPCPIVSLDTENLLGQHIINIRENINFFRYSNNKELIKNNFSPYQITKLEQALREDENCFIDAHLRLHKSAGDIHFSFHKFREVYDEIKQRNDNKGIFKKLNVSHKIFKFSLIDDGDFKKIKNNFSNSNSPDLNEFIERYKKNSFVFPNFFKEHKTKEDMINSNYEYFIILVPHIFYNEFTNETIFTYLFSMTYNERELKQEDEEMPLLLINYDFSPITMKFSLVRRSFLHFLTNICAIIGGVFVSFRMIHNFFLYYN